MDRRGPSTQARPTPPADAAPDLLPTAGSVQLCGHGGHVPEPLGATRVTKPNRRARKRKPVLPLRVPDPTEETCGIGKGHMQNVPERARIARLWAGIGPAPWLQVY